MTLKTKLLTLLVLLLVAGNTAISQKFVGNQVQCDGIEVRLISGDCDLGLLNPDGAKILSSDYDLIFEVQGEKSKQVFSASGTFDWKDRNVFITGNRWYYNGWQQSNGNSYFPIMQGNGNNFTKDDCKTKSSKKAYFKFDPGTVFAAPDATEGYYSFEVTLSVEDLSY